MQGRTKFPILSGSLGLFQRRTLQQFLILTAASFTATPLNSAKPAEHRLSLLFVTNRTPTLTQILKKQPVTKLDPFFSRPCFLHYVPILTRNLRKRSTTPKNFCVEPDSHSGGIRRTPPFTNFPIPRSTNIPPIGCPLRLVLQNSPATQIIFRPRPRGRENGCDACSPSIDVGTATHPNVSQTSLLPSDTPSRSGTLRCPRTCENCSLYWH
jgi:hypothetical protein